MPILIAISPGELADRRSILEIKVERVADPAKRERAALQLAALDAPRWPPAVRPLVGRLKVVNAGIWDDETRIRQMDEAGDLGASFVAVARRIRWLNDERARIKAEIDRALDAVDLAEVKDHGAARGCSAA